MLLWVAALESEAYQSCARDVTEQYIEPTIPIILEVNKQVNYSNRYSIRISSSNPPFRQEHKTNATACVIAPSLRSPAPSS